MQLFIFMLPVIRQDICLLRYVNLLLQTSAWCQKNSDGTRLENIRFRHQFKTNYSVALDMNLFKF